MTKKTTHNEKTASEVKRHNMQGLPTWVFPANGWASLDEATKRREVERERRALELKTRSAYVYEGPYILPYVVGGYLPNPPKGYFWLTPPLAQALLDMSQAQGNRKIKKGKKDAYRRDILAGNWNGYAGTPIRIYFDLVTGNGHHRFELVIELGICLLMPGIDVVPTSLRPEYSPLMYGEDNGAVRSKADQLNRDPHEVAVAENIFDICTTKRGQVSTLDETRSVLEAFDHEILGLNVKSMHTACLAQSCLLTAVVMVGTEEAFAQYKAFNSVGNEYNGVTLTHRLTVIKNKLISAYSGRGRYKAMVSEKVDDALDARKNSAAVEDEIEALFIGATRGKREGLRKMAMIYQAFKDPKGQTQAPDDDKIMATLREIRNKALKRLAGSIDKAVLAKRNTDVIVPASSAQAGPTGYGIISQMQAYKQPRA